MHILNIVHDHYQYNISRVVFGLKPRFIELPQEVPEVLTLFLLDSMKRANCSLHVFAR